ncbi:uncharacterized protein LOC116616063 [Nematostella vectensis]|uniref:uncharacterized protein LOC116616063 n=1 Tax=Nematostella vectensis TaxID=45351 RepID=UPI0020779225|nr:uncharacterized protein LOC116616063 [Nematostella vectensis]
MKNLLLKTVIRLIFAKFATGFQCHDTTNSGIYVCDVGSRGACVTVELAATNISSGAQRTVTQRLCIADHSCNVTRICDGISFSMQQWNISRCHAKCCNTSLCNAPQPTSTVSSTTTEVEQRSQPEVAGTHVVTAPRPLCYKCPPGTSAETCTQLPSTVQCESSESVCFSVIGKDRIGEIGYRGCTDTEHCDASKLCNQASRDLFLKTGEGLQDCNGYCCTGEMCNRFNPTRPYNREQETGSTERDIKVVRRETPASSNPPINCYRCVPDNLGSLCKREARASRCPLDRSRTGYDGCFSMTGVITNSSTGMVKDEGIWKDCSVVSADCNENGTRCDRLTSVLKDRGLTLKNCYVNCCQGDLCNNFVPSPTPEVMMARSGTRQCTVGCTRVLLPVLLVVMVTSGYK